MIARDPHRFVNELDETAIDRLINRLESRAKDDIFTSLFDKYIGRLALPTSAHVLEVGCGTGAMMRSLVRREDFSGLATGVDQSPQFIEAAKRFSIEEAVSDRIEFLVGDAHNLEFPTSSFDAVIANTLVSHVTEPIAVLKEMSRVVRPGGVVVIFDGDYASLTYAYPDHEFGREMDEALANASFNNPMIMRELPSLLPDIGLEVTSAWGDAVTEIGNGSYFKSFAETYAPYVANAGLMPSEVVDEWLAIQKAAMDNDTFFASCTYYTYLTQRRLHA